MVSLLSSFDTGHDDVVHDAQLDFYGTRLATCASDHRIRVFDAQSGAILSDWEAHDGPVWQVSWSPLSLDSIAQQSGYAAGVSGASMQLLASCSYDQSVAIWREAAPSDTGVSEWHRVFEYCNHTSSVNAISWCPAEFGMALACASADGSLSILQCTDSDSNCAQWEATKIDAAHPPGANAVSWQPFVPDLTGNIPLGGNMQQQANSVRRVVSGGCDCLIKIWRSTDGATWQCESTLDAHTDWVRDVEWAPSLGGVHVERIASASQDGRVLIWTFDGPSLSSASAVEPRDRDRSVPIGPAAGTWRYVELCKVDEPVWHVSWNATGDLLAVSAGENRATIWKQALDGDWVCVNDATATSRQADAAKRLAANINERDAPNNTID